MLPKVLFAAEAVNLKEEDVANLQRAGNGVLRRILKAPRYATLAGMRGEVGIGSMKGRIVRSRLQYLRRSMQGSNELLKKIIGRMRGGGGRTWMGRNLKYMEWAGVTMGELERMTEGQLRRRIGDRVEVE